MKGGEAGVVVGLGVLKDEYSSGCEDVSVEYEGDYLIEAGMVVGGVAKNKVVTVCGRRFENTEYIAFYQPEVALLKGLCGFLYEPVLCGGFLYGCYAGSSA